MYELVWQREVIDEAETKEEAEYLKGEYQIAYKGYVSVRKVK